MDKMTMFSYVDHTLLKPTATWDEIAVLCGEAVLHKTASVCIPPSYVKRVAEQYGDTLTVCTVVGFPLGYSITAAKVLETEAAIRDGASEIDMVINIGDVKNGDFDLVTAEIAALKHAAGDHILKVIIEACYLTETEKIRLCQCVTEAGADYIKTSTGFGTGGATLEDIALFKAHIGPNVKIKAAGGIRTVEDMEAFLTLGCARLGTSSAVKLLAGEETTGY
ncbi:MAG: deoxyribose-phosphate aldolase [Oscillospiraceae bacterium]|nr:deoxyribose-phosphate aldolase [Oscillospiraceae bacterium]